MSSINAQNASHSKFSCGTVVTPEDERMILEKVRREESRSGSCDDPIFAGDKTYKLVLEYVKYSNGTTFPSTDPLDNQMKEIKDYIDSKFNALGIYFTYIEVQQNCDNCHIASSTNWERNNPLVNTIDFQDCLWGRLVRDPEGITTGLGNPVTGRFWAQANPQDMNYQNVVHELGHALGLFHTFNNFNINTQSPINELVRQDNIACSCNCLSKGDYICDTPVDPYIDKNVTFNFSMFGGNNFTILNANNLVDACQTNYTVLNNDPTGLNNIFFNMMSYHYKNLERTFTNGQISFVKNYNLGKPWETNTSTQGMIMEGGFAVNSPTTIITSKNITGDIIVNSTLTIKNATISMLENKSIILKDGGKLILDNSHIVAFEGMECMPTAKFWNGVKVESSGLTSITLKNKSAINNAKIGIEKNTTHPFLLKILSGSNINCFWNTSLKLNGPSTVDLDIFDSNINGFIDLNGIRTINFSNSNFNYPYSNLSGSGLTNISKIQNSNVNIINDCYFSGPIMINNPDVHNINIRNSTFNTLNEAIAIENCGGIALVRDNNFFGGDLNMNNCKNFDVFNNRIESFDGLVTRGFIASQTPLIFKNQFNCVDYSYRQNSLFSKPTLHCNLFNSKGTYDLFMTEPFALIQGAPNLAPANQFSRTTTEIKYTGDQEIKYFFRKIGTEEPLNISGTDINTPAKFTKIEITNQNAVSACDIPYPNTAPIPSHCTNGVRDGNEQGVDCGGSCPPCAIDLCCAQCTNGIKDGTETDVDCGGTCPPCHCYDRILNNGETSIDCGGPCPPCFGPSQCGNGVQDGDETGIDCGGSCGPCSDNIAHCNNDVLDGDETGIDCGGSCPPCNIAFLPHCYNGVQDGGETGIDCGGSCALCTSTYNESIYEAQGPAAYSPGNHTPYLTQLNTIYGSTYIPQGRDFDILAAFASHALTLDGGQSCDLQNFIRDYSATFPSSVLQRLQSFSPNVSANAIHVLFDYSQYFSSDQIASILILNPAVLSDRYISEIVYKTNTFTSSQKSSIINTYRLGSARQSAEEVLNTKLQYKNAILRDNIVMIGMNTPKDYHKLRSLYAQNPEMTRVFDIAASYADQQRYDLAVLTLQNADMCTITDPIYKAQRTALISLYSQQGSNGNRSIGEEKDLYLSIARQEHGMATDIAASYLSERDKATLPIFARWKYDPLNFRISESKDNMIGVVIFPNPTSSMLNVYINNISDKDKIDLTIKSIDGKIVLDKKNINMPATQINTSELTNGIYFIEIKSNKEKVIYSDKFIKID